MRQLSSTISPSRRGRPPAAIKLKPKDEKVLRHRARSLKLPHQEVLKAKVIVGAAAGDPSETIANQIGMSHDFVSYWRGRYAAFGIVGLKATPRSGRPCKFTPVQRLQLVAVACEQGPRIEGLNGWTTDLLVDALKQRGIATMSRSSVNRILLHFELQPHRQKMWLHSTDPLFREKAAEIVELYLHPPADSTVWCVDEKTGMQAIQRKYSDRPARIGQLARREYEYIRHGTQTSIAGFNTQTGDVIAETGPTRTAEDLLKFMDALAARVPGTVHIIWDNLNIHKGPRWEEFNKRHAGRFQFHYTPIHASWVNQIEIWFSILQRRSLRKGSFASKEELKETVEAFITHWNNIDKHPFKWTFAGFQEKT